MYKSPIVHPVSTPSNVGTQLANFSSPMTSYPPEINKRKDSKVFSDAPPVAKRLRNKSSARTFPDKGNPVYKLCVWFLFLFYASSFQIFVNF